MIRYTWSVWVAVYFAYDILWWFDAPQPFALINVMCLVSEVEERVHYQIEIGTSEQIRASHVLIKNIHCFCECNWTIHFFYCMTWLHVAIQLLRGISMHNCLYLYLLLISISFLNRFSFSSSQMQNGKTK